MIGTIESRIITHGRWLLYPITWTIFAFRPLRSDKIDLALLEDGEGDGASSEASHSDWPIC